MDVGSLRTPETVGPEVIAANTSATAASGGRPRSELRTVSALFAEAAAVDEAVKLLTSAGMPRDLIEVVVAPEAAARFYGGTARATRYQTLRFAGIGALAGLIIGVVLSLVMISLPSFASAGPEAVVQLLGPNVMTVSGAAIGAVVGRFTRRGPDARHRRAGESPASILLVVRLPAATQRDAVAALLASAGGTAVQG